MPPILGLVPEQILGVHGPATTAGASSCMFMKQTEAVVQRICELAWQAEGGTIAADG